MRKVEASAKPKLAEVRQKLENDWRAQTVKDREAKAYQTLLDSYTIRIAKPLSGCSGWRSPRFS